MTAIHKKNDLLLYLKMEGAHNSTTFEDSSDYDRSVIAANVRVSHLQQAVGEGSAYFTYDVSAGDGTHLKVENALDYEGDVTIEYFVYFESAERDYRSTMGGDFQIIYGQSVSPIDGHAPGSYVALNIGSNTPIYFSYANYNFEHDNWVPGFTVEEQGWEHHAFVVNGLDVSFFKNGIRQATASGVLSSSPSFTNPIVIGTYATGLAAMDYTAYGWIDEFIITEGVKYTGDFEVSYEPIDIEALQIPLISSLALSVEYAISDPSWLTGYMFRWKFQVDRTKFFIDRDNYYLPILLCTDVGMNRTNLTHFFLAVGSSLNTKKIAITYEDTLTEVPVKIAYWDQSGFLARIYAVVPKIRNMDWHADTTLYLYYGSLIDNENVEDI